MYLLCLSGVLLNVFTEVPDDITYPMMVIGLVGAVVVQYWQYIKLQNIYRADMKEIKLEFSKVIEKYAQKLEINTDVNNAILSRLKNFEYRYDVDRQSKSED